MFCVCVCVCVFWVCVCVCFECVCFVCVYVFWVCMYVLSKCVCVSVCFKCVCVCVLSVCVFWVSVCVFVCVCVCRKGGDYQITPILSQNLANGFNFTGNFGKNSVNLSNANSNHWDLKILDLPVLAPGSAQEPEPVYDGGKRWLSSLKSLWHQIYTSHVIRKPVFGCLRPGKTRTGLLSYRC